MATSEPCIIVDRTHLGRRSSGIERITNDLFSDEALSPLPVRGTPSGAGRALTAFRQLVLNPLSAVRKPDSVWVFSGFPPSPAFGRLPQRSILYVHDLFLIERPADLNRSGRLYMAPNFRSALRRFRWFLANSIATADRLRPHVDAGATVMLARPPARDVLGLGGAPHRASLAAPGPVRVGMIGTIEPRKNYTAAVAICRALEQRLKRPVALEIIGRKGWGPDAERLTEAANVTLHGFVEDGRIAEVIGRWTLFLSTSHDEGLGLPLLEVQHAGLPIVAPDAPVFREVLGESGTFIDPADPQGAAAAIASLFDQPSRDFQALGRRNIERWNSLAAADHAGVLALLSARLAHVRGSRG